MTRNDDTLTTEDEQTADELLADIQSAVDEMLNDFEATTLSPDPPPPSQSHLTTLSTDTVNEVFLSTILIALLNVSLSISIS